MMEDSARIASELLRLARSLVGGEFDMSADLGISRDGSERTAAGRPRKKPVEEPAPAEAPRRRGRPRKTEVVEEVVEAPAEKPSQKRRGRPRKTQPVVEEPVVEETPVVEEPPVEEPVVEEPVEEEDDLGPVCTPAQIISQTVENKVSKGVKAGLSIKFSGGWSPDSLFSLEATDGKITIVGDSTLTSTGMGLCTIEVSIDRAMHDGVPALKAVVKYSDAVDGEEGAMREEKTYEADPIFMKLGFNTSNGGEAFLKDGKIFASRRFCGKYSWKLLKSIGDFVSACLLKKAESLGAEFERKIEAGK